MKVLVCDDFKRRGERVLDIVANVQGLNVETTGIFEGELKDWIDQLYDRVRSVVHNDSDVHKLGSRSISSDAFGSSSYDLAILDNDLTALATDGATITADWIAAYVRAFLDVSCVVSLNKIREVDFDLCYLMGDPETPADLAINENHLSNLGLWTGRSEDSPDTFLPWYWPKFVQVAHKRRAQIEFIKAQVNEPIFQTLSFPEECLDFLSRHAKGALSPTAYDDTALCEVTFKDFFVDSCTSFSVRKKREALVASGVAGVEDIVARTVAAELEKWIRQYVITPQDVLIDLPHLIVRMPFVMGRRSDDVGAWNRCLETAESPYGLDRDIYMRFLRSAAFSSDIWTKSPCFWWPVLKSSKELNEMFMDESVQWTDAVFSEDTSMFILPQEGTVNPRNFVGEFEGSWRRRYVMNLENKHYAPKSQFAR